MKALPDTRASACFSISGTDTVRVDVGPAAGRVERTAARELSVYLGRMLKREVAMGPGPADRIISVGTPASSPDIEQAARLVRLADLKPDGFVVAPAGRDRLRIMARNGNGVLYGVYAFLEALGVRFAPVGLEWVADQIPARPSIAFGTTLREEPSFPIRELGATGWVKEVFAEHKAFYDTDVRATLPVYTRALDWMAKVRLNAAAMWLWWFGASPETRWYWSRDGECCSDTVSGLILYRDYPGLRWAERYGDQVRRNQDLLRDILRYAADRGIRITIGGFAEPGYPGGLCRAYPEFGADGTQYIEHEPAWLRFQESRFRELFETFPELGGYLYVLADDSGPHADVRARRRESDGREIVNGQGDVIASEKLARLVRMNEAMLRGRDAAGSRAEIRFWEWAAAGVYPGDASSMGRMKARVSVARLNALLPESIGIHMRMSAGEPTEPQVLNPFLTQWGRHRRSVALHQAAEHLGLTLFPTVFWESSWKERALYARRCGIEGLTLEAGYWPGETDGTGLNLCDLDIHGFARLAWNTDVDRDAVWHEWAGLYVPQVPRQAVDLLKPFHRILTAMCGGDGMGGAVPARWRFQGIPLDKLAAWNVPSTRAHGLLMIAARHQAVQGLDEALAKLDAMRDALGAARYGRWRANLLTQQTLARMLEAFVAATVWGSLIEQGLAEPGDERALDQALRELGRWVKDYEHPVPPLYARLFGFGWMRGDEWRAVFDALICEFRRRLGRAPGDGLPPPARGRTPRA